MFYAVGTIIVLTCLGLVVAGRSISDPGVLALIAIAAGLLQVALLHRNGGGS